MESATEKAFAGLFVLDFTTTIAGPHCTRLLADLSQTVTPFFCPHGRPIVSRLSLREIKRELGRTW